MTLPRLSALLLSLIAGMLVVPALAVTVLRWVQPDWGPAVQAVAFAPLALVAYIGSLAPLLILLVLAWRRAAGRSWAVTSLVLVLLAIGLHGWWISPQFVGAAPQPGEGQHSIRVMNLNLFVGDADASDVVAQAVAQGAEILVLEEVTPAVLGELEGAEIDAAFPHRAGEPADRVGGTMVFSTYPISSVTRLPTSFESLALDVAAPGGVVRMFAVHPYPPVRGAEHWREDLAAIAAAAGEDPDLDLIVGDFNATPDQDAFQRLADVDFRSAAEISNAGWQPTWPANGEVSVLGIGLPRLVQIDHVLVGPSMTALATDTAIVAGTDHSAVVAEVAFR